MSADDDLVSEIINYKRKAPEPIHCAGLGQRLLDPSLTAMKSLLILPLIMELGAIETKAQTAYTEWVEYMTGVVWGSVSFLPFLVR